MNSHYSDPFREACPRNYRKCPLVLEKCIWDSKTVRLIRLVILATYQVLQPGTWASEGCPAV